MWTKSSRSSLRTQGELLHSARSSKKNCAISDHIGKLLITTPHSVGLYGRKHSYFALRLVWHTHCLSVDHRVIGILERSCKDIESENEPCGLHVSEHSAFRQSRAYWRLIPSRNIRQCRGNRRDLRSSCNSKYDHRSQSSNCEMALRSLRLPRKSFVSVIIKPKSLIRCAPPSACGD
jgi:hypothetical protein